MDLGLRDKVAIVSAASKGLGKAVALGLATSSARIHEGYARCPPGPIIAAIFSSCPSRRRFEFLDNRLNRQVDARLIREP